MDFVFKLLTSSLGERPLRTKVDRKVSSQLLLVHEVYQGSIFGTLLFCFILMTFLMRLILKLYFLLMKLIYVYLTTT